MCKRFYSTALIRRVSSSWRKQQPKQFRQKTHPFASNKDPFCRERVKQMPEFLAASGLEATSTGIIRAINLCGMAKKENDSHARHLIYLFAALGVILLAASLVLGRVGIPYFPPLSLHLFLSVVVFEGIFMLPVCIYKERQNEEIDNFQRDLSILELNQIYNDQNAKDVLDAPTPFRNIDFITNFSKDWNETLSTQSRLLSFLSPDTKGMHTPNRIYELLEFLKDEGINPTEENLNELIELCDAAASKTTRITSYYTALVISILSAPISTIYAQSSENPLATVAISCIVTLAVCILILFVLPIPQRKQIRLIRLKNDLIVAKNNHLYIDD